jgi:hypothetical protein
VREKPVAALLRTTVALVTNAPFGSVTVPRRELVAVCDHAEQEKRVKTKKTKAACRNDLMVIPPNGSEM